MQLAHAGFRQARCILVKSNDEGFLQSLVTGGTSPRPISTRPGHRRPAGMTISEALARLGYMDGEGLITALSAWMEIPRVRLNPEAIDPEVIKLVDPDKAHEYEVLPLQLEGDMLTLAVCGPVNPQASEMLSFKTGFSLAYVLCTEEEMAHALMVVYGAPALAGPEDEGPTQEIKFVEGDRAEAQRRTSRSTRKAWSSSSTACWPTRSRRERATYTSSRRWTTPT